jgi:hypothetical protein
VLGEEGSSSIYSSVSGEPGQAGGRLLCDGCLGVSFRRLFSTLGGMGAITVRGSYGMISFEKESTQKETITMGVVPRWLGKVGRGATPGPRSVLDRKGKARKTGIGEVWRSKFGIETKEQELFLVQSRDIANSVEFWEGEFTMFD